MKAIVAGIARLVAAAALVEGVEQVVEDLQAQAVELPEVGGEDTLHWLAGRCSWRGRGCASGFRRT